MNDISILRPRVLIPFIIVTVIWGSTWLVIRDQLGVVPPSWSVAYRFVIGSAGMFGYAILNKDPLRLSLGDMAFSALIGLLLFFGNFNFVYRAEAHVTSGLVAVVFALLVVPNAILGAIFLKRPISKRFLIGSGVALAGVAMLILHEARGDGASAYETFLGVSFTLIGVFLASIANVMQGSERARAVPMSTMLAWAMVVGTLVNAVFAWVTSGAPVFDTRPGYVAGTVYLGLFASSIAFTLYFHVIRAVGPGVAAYSSVLTPILAMILSTLFEHYHWSVLAAAGGMVALAGLVIALSAPRPTLKSG